jgi:hypothetical protein
MPSVPLSNVNVPSHVEWFVKTGGALGEDQFRVEIYTGNVVVEFSGGDTTHRDTYVTYLPLSVDSAGSFRIRRYGTADVIPAINSAIIVTPVGVSLEDDDTTFSVDAWGLQAKPQSFPGVDQPPCLILSCALDLSNLGGSYAPQ